MIKIYHILLVFSIVFLVGFTGKPNIKDGNVEKINSVNFRNLYKINDSVYRSEQPNKNGMCELESLGIKTILNLRNCKDDINEIKDTHLILKHIPINTWRFSYDDIVNALAVLGKSRKPILVHCLHGSDRTGAIVAAYRMTFENWSKEDAIAEFKEEKFGYHEKWFPNILDVLQSLDIEALKSDVNQNK